MRLVALACVGCTALNPAFGDADARDEGTNSGDGTGNSRTSTTEPGPGTNGGTGSADSSPPGTTSPATSTSDTAPGLDTTSEDSSTGPSRPTYSCGEEGFDIEITRPAIDCGMLPSGQGLNVNLDCMFFSETNSGLAAAPATGCGTGACVPSGPADTILTVPGIALAQALELPDTPCGYLWARGTVLGGECRWDTLSLFHADEEIALILSNAIESTSTENVLPLPNDGDSIPLVPYSADVLAPATCGDRTDKLCASSGWRAFEFAETPEPAAPDGVPVSALHGDQDLSVFNWGLQFDRQCVRHGRWAVVEAGQEWVLD